MVPLRHRIAFTILRPIKMFEHLNKGMFCKKTVVQKSSYELQAFNFLHNLFLILIYDTNVIFLIRFSLTTAVIFPDSSNVVISTYIN